MRRHLLGTIIILLAIGGADFASASPLSFQEEWMGMYLMGQKVGYSYMKADPSPKSADRLEIISETVMKVALLGQSLEQRVTINQEATKIGSPVSLTMSMSSAGHKTIIKAKFDPDAVHCSIDTGGSVSKKDVPVPNGVTLSLDPELADNSVLAVGKSVSSYYFNPANLTIEKATTEALRKESITSGGISYQATVIVSHTPMGDMTSWEDAEGRVLKAEGIVGITMLRETKEEALSLPDTKFAPPADLAKALAVDSGKTLEDPREASLMKIRLDAPDMPDPVSDDRQTVKRIDKDAVELTIAASPLDSKDTISLADAAKRQPDWVKPSPYLQSDNSQVKTLAKTILNGETKSFWAALKLRDWVHQNMQVKADIGVVRSGLDVMKDRRGVCRDFATLYATLARASGLPTRIATGLVYSDGDFYYHAWAESFVGKWVDIDPTLGTGFVDATHIKLSHGDSEAMFSSAQIMGRIKAKILDYQVAKTEN